MLPSRRPETGREPWPEQPSSGPPAPRAGGDDGGPERGGTRRVRRDGEPGRRPAGDPDDGHDQDVEETPPVEVRRSLALAVAGFAVLLGLGLVLAAQTSGPGHRLPFTAVILGVQALSVLAWTMASRPPALMTVAGVGVATAIVADTVAVRSDPARLMPLVQVLLVGLAAAVVGQFVRRVDRAQVIESLRGTMLIVAGSVAFPTMIVLTRIPMGTQVIMVCLVAAGVALAVARITDAFAAWPRLAPQVPRGAAGVVGGAMIGTMVSAVLGSYLVTPFTPTRAAIMGLVAAVVAVLADLAVGYAEAGRVMAGEPSPRWGIGHMQGPLTGFALAAPAAYVLCKLVL
ncbi:hypothetical protein [Salinispora tropica]|uniref:Phosphatidate cytidylyltransferase n=1 Tax=Salinispora tropica (strain ATCC BAA-916 / DSM 44818 / JCM 13857 / NBRC 105044 / CNB-440) TaxID=369723 RepID=A4X1M9_SALTO|nr:hypothetical protein [Salinispora tropica]ABP52779.1 hypothetical protein Strop_0294 [Salinispora tropica CNB-440]